MKETKFLENAASVRITPVGSRVTCNPAPMNTDIDYLVLTTDMGYLSYLMEKEGYSCDSDDRYEGPDIMAFVSYRKGNVNFITTDCTAFESKFLAATSVAKRLNLLNKADRIALFQAVLYGVGCGDKPE